MAGGYCYNFEEGLIHFVIVSLHHGKPEKNMWWRTGSFEAYFFLELMAHPAQLPRRLLLLSWYKSNQKIKSAEMLLCARGLSRTNPKTLRAGIFLPGYPITRLPACKKFLCPAHHTGRQRFRLLPEAYLLTGNQRGMCKLVRFCNWYQ